MNRILRQIKLMVILILGMTSSHAMETQDEKKPIDIGDTVLFRVVNATELNINIYHFEFRSPPDSPYSEASIDMDDPLIIKAKNFLFPVYLKDACWCWERQTIGEFKVKLKRRNGQIVFPRFEYPLSEDINHYFYVHPSLGINRKLITREWVYFILSNGEATSEPFYLRICRFFPNFDCMKYVLLNDEEAAFNALLPELKRLIVLGTFVLE